MGTAMMTRGRPILFDGPMVRAILEGRIEFNDDVLRTAFEAGLTIKEIAAIAGCSTYPVGRKLRCMGLRREAKRRKGVGVGPSNPAWKGGRRVRPDGYVLVWTPDGERLEHRLVMEQYLGRKLSVDEVIHHRDGNKANNVIENLELTNQGDHIRHHLKEMQHARYGC